MYTYFKRIFVFDHVALKICSEGILFGYGQGGYPYFGYHGILTLLYPADKRIPQPLIFSPGNG